VIECYSPNHDIKILLLLDFVYLSLRVLTTAVSSIMQTFRSQYISLNQLLHTFATKGINSYIMKPKVRYVLNCY